MASKIINDLNNVAEIIGGLGLSIAAAQRAMNLDYLQSLERLVAIAIALQGGTRKDAGGNATPLSEDDRAFIRDFLSKFAPTRYQFTETTLAVRLDLAQTLSASGSAGLGVGVGAVAVNASFAFAYGSEYQAAAECKTILHAIKPDADPALFQQISQRAAQANSTNLTLPERASVDTKTIDTSNRIIEKLLGAKPAEIKPEEAEKKAEKKA